ncbi:MAG: hypothetical protein ABR969_00870 [Sedimentisphaerales bacterium]|jgi:hypothetical protein
MVTRQAVREGKFVYWIDGRLPPKTTLVPRTSIGEMVRHGMNRDILVNNPFYQNSHRLQLDRYEYFIKIVDFFVTRLREPESEALNYTAYLLNPFGDSSLEFYLTRELAQAKMYHKNQKNFRALLLLSDIDYAEEVEKSVDELISTVSFRVSSPDSFKEYASFQNHLDEFIFRTAEYATEPATLAEYLCNTGFAIERSTYKKL